MTMKIRKLLFFFASILFIQKIFSSTPLRTMNLSEEHPSWTAALGGGAVAPFVETSYGVAILSEGRLLTGLTHAGKILWQKTFRGKASPYMTAFGDFIYIVTNSNKLNFMNPSGVTLWTVDCPFTITSSPVVEKDGRVIVKGSSGLACYGINGKKKWEISTPAQSDIPICFMNDGSILVFLTEGENGKTVAKRYSPFGIFVEDLRFAGKVLSAKTCKDGAIISLSNGAIGICSVSAGEADQSWVKRSSFSSGADALAYSEKTGHIAFFYQIGGSVTADIVRASDGEFITQVPVGNFRLSENSQVRSTDSGFFISDSSNACEFSENGTILWAASLIDKSKWNYMIYTRENNLIFSMTNWVLSSYKMSQNIKRKISPVYKKSDDSFVKIKQLSITEKSLGIRFLPPETLEEIDSMLENGSLGENESDILSRIKSEAYEYLDSLTTISLNPTEPSYFYTNPTYTENLLKIMSKTGTSEFAHIFAELLKNETDRNYLTLLIKYAGEQKYDPDGEILNAFEFIMKNRIRTNDSSVLETICDATYEICRFMGRPALIFQGKNIVAKMLFPQYSEAVRDYARATFDRIKYIEK